MIDVAKERQLLRERFQQEAEWRQEKTTEYPKDERNLVAAKRYDRLAATVVDVPDELIHAYAEWFENEGEVELEHELLKRVFSLAPGCWHT